jgi:CHU_C Type IX secretion signal domain
MIKFLLILFILVHVTGFSQKLIYQNICKCGVSTAGFSAGISNNGFNENLFIDLSTSLSIESAYLIFYSFDFPEELDISFNGDLYFASDLNRITPYLNVSGTGMENFKTALHLIDVTNSINPSQNIYNLNVPNAVIDNKYLGFYLIVNFSNLDFVSTNLTILINTQNQSNDIIYNYSDLNLIDLSYDVGLAVQTDIMWDTVSDGSFLKVNGINFGLIGGSDASNPFITGAGVMGHFTYTNNQLTGSSDDTADALFSGPDGLAKINSAIGGNNQIELELVSQSWPNPSIFNQYISFPLAYTTPCVPFPVTTPKDTTICQNTTLQLSATGGSPTNNSATGYEWSPAVGLSCTDCPNPVFTADSSMFYTVRIWNTDSCSIVRPLKINVRPAPLWDSLAIMPSVCGASTGAVTLFALPNNTAVQSWTEVGGNTQLTNTFLNLSGGNHTFYFNDTNGCQSSDTTVFVPSEIPTIASFTANPLSGAAPLSVDFTNTSQFATDYLWTLNGINQGNNFQNYTFDTSGTYFVELIAWQYDIACADTFSVQIIAFDSLILQIPNVFSPNGDGTNELFTITVNQDLAYDFTIVNRWGNTMVLGNGNLKIGVPSSLWDGSDALDGVYFLKIEFTQFDGKKVNHQGFFHVVR